MIHSKLTQIVLASINFSFCGHVVFDKSPHRPFLVFGIFILVYGLKRIPEARACCLCNPFNGFANVLLLPLHQTIVLRLH
ncbi:hypothetical protein Q3G72_002986 [Acer saccharum]|nr:hypothetical protein Q3G72_002986 [Acer saccharum]